MKAQRILVIALLVMSFALIGQTYGQETSSMKTVLTNCVVIDCTGKPPMEDMTVVITDNTITEIIKGTYRQSPGEENVRVFDIKGSYVLPGLWNVHARLDDVLPDPKQLLDNERVGRSTIRGGHNAMDALLHGFTGLRIVGERDYLDVAWRDAFESGFFRGPRIFASGNPITAIDGHGWEPVGTLAIQIDGPRRMRKAVREHIKNGVDHITIMDTELSLNELKAAVKAAHQKGLRVCAYSAEPTSNLSVEAGVDCLEHGYGLTDETIQLMAEKGVFYVPTINCNERNSYITNRELQLEMMGFDVDRVEVWSRTNMAYADERSPESALLQRRILQKAVKAGVKVCTGGDSKPLGAIGLLEIEEFVRSGLTEMQALIAATRNCAELCKVSEKLGTVEEGKLADLIVVSENPLDKISNLRRLEMVFKEGKPINLEIDEGLNSFWQLFVAEQ